METSKIQKARRQVKQRRSTQQLLSPFSRFARHQTAGGTLLLIFAVIALLCANIPALNIFHRFWSTDLSLSFNYNATFLPLRTVGEWVNNALMVIFFFAIGLEVKREMAMGELSSVRKSLLPIFAAIGGMIVPAIIYFAINNNTPGEHGWGIPMTTDIAFVLGVLALLGRRVPIALKVFLTALAIVSNLVATIAMALVYPTQFLHGEFLAAALCVLAVLVVLNVLKINRTFPYIFLGILLWFFTLRSGVHATVAGIALALTIPSNIKLNQIRFYVRSKYLIERYRDAYSKEPAIKHEIEQAQLNNLSIEIRKATPLLTRLEHSLQPWITYCILPLFAWANAGVVIDGNVFGLLGNTVVLGIFFGLLIGKPVGITLMSWLAVKLNLASMPANTRWSQIVGAGILASIGFTMSMFINTMAFNGTSEQSLQDAGKLAILITSICAGLVGLIYMSITCKKETE